VIAHMCMYTITPDSHQHLKVKKMIWPGYESESSEYPTRPRGTC